MVFKNNSCIFVQIKLINKMNFEQVPEWSNESQFTITGKQFNQLSAVYGDLHVIMNEIFEHNLNAGNITVKYIDPEGNDIPKEQIDKMLKDAENNTIM